MTYCIAIISDKSLQLIKFIIFGTENEKFLSCKVHTMHPGLSHDPHW